MKTHKCIKCEKKIKVQEHFKPRCVHEQESFILNDANTWVTIAHFGSKFDSDIIKLTVCDDCLEAYLKKS